MSRESKLVKNTFILAIGTFLPKLAAFLTTPILTGYLTKEQYGTYDLVGVLVGLVLPIATLQIHTAGFRFLVGHKDDRDLAKLYLSNILAFVIPVCLATLFVTYFFLPSDDPMIRLWICIYLFFDTIVSEFRQITRGMSRNLDYSISAIISACVKLILAVVLVQLMKQELLGAIVAVALSPVLSLLFLFFKIRAYELISPKVVEWKVIKEMLAYAWPMVPNNMSSWVIRMSDRFVVTGFKGLAANAVYAAACKIPSLLTLAQTTFSMAWQENASIFSKDKDVDKYYSKMFGAMMNFYAGSLGRIIAATPVLFPLLIRGKGYEDAYDQMPILFMAMFFHCMAAFFGGIYIAFKATTSVGITTLVAAAVNLTVDLVLIKSIGLYAASGSTLVSYIFLFVYRMIDVRKLVKIKYDPVQVAIIIGLLLIESALFFFKTLTFNLINFAIALVAAVVLNRQIIKAMLRKVFKRRKG